MSILVGLTNARNPVWKNHSTFARNSRFVYLCSGNLTDGGSASTLRQKARAQKARNRWDGRAMVWLWMMLKLQKRSEPESVKQIPVYRGGLSSVSRDGGALFMPVKPWFPILSHDEPRQHLPGFILGSKCVCINLPRNGEMLLTLLSWLAQKASNRGQSLKNAYCHIEKRGRICYNIGHPSDVR